MTYDFCIVGAGVAGKYIASKMKNYKTLLLSAKHDTYISDSLYSFNSHLGQTDTWSEKAAGFVTFPKKDNFKHLPISERKYAQYKNELLSELDIQSMELHCSEEVNDYNHKLANIYNIEPLQYLYSTFNFQDRKARNDDVEFKKDWASRRKQWDFLNEKVQYGKCLYFDFKDGVVELVVIDELKNEYRVKAKKFIIAAHTPGTIQLLQRTYERNCKKDLIEYLGKGFTEHPQLSIGTLCRSMNVRRDLPLAMMYYDGSFEGVNYRIEVNNTPPNGKAIEFNLNRYPQYNKEQYYNHFVRLTLVLELPAEWENRVEFIKKDNNSNVSHYKFGKSFEEHLYSIRSRLLEHVIRKHLSNPDIFILNTNYNWYFSGHPAGGTYGKEVINKDFTTTISPNIMIASLSTISTVGLFNPTFTLLVLCKQILANLRV